MDNNCGSCGNREMTFVRYTIANGRIQLRKQCLKCGVLPTTNYKFSLFKDISKVPFYDPNLRQEFRNKCLERRELKLEMGRKDYYYEVYLKSPQWKAKRENTLKRDNYTCVCCEEKATQVHHINYKHVYQEKEKELISVCKSCHEGIHGNMVVYFGAFRADFGRLGLCQHCDEYHQNGNDSLCNACKK